MNLGEGTGLMSLSPLHDRRLRYLDLYTSSMCNNRNVHKGKEYACYAWSHRAYMEDGIPQLPFCGILLVTMDGES